MSDEDDPELWGAIHRLACILDNLHEDEMLRTDKGMTDLFVQGTKIVNRAKDLVSGLRTAPPDYKNMSTLLRAQGEAEASLKKAASKLEKEEDLFKKEMETLKKKHQPLIDTEKAAVAEVKKRLHAAEKAVHDLNDEYTKEQKKKEKDAEEHRKAQKRADDLNAKAQAAAAKAEAVKSIE